MAETIIVRLNIYQTEEWVGNWFCDIKLFSLCTWASNSYDSTSSGADNTRFHMEITMKNSQCTC